MTIRSIKKLDEQKVNTKFSVAFEGLNVDNIKGSESKNPDDKIFSDFEECLGKRNELYYVVPHVPADRKKIPMDFDFVVFFGKVLYGVSKEVSELSNLLKLDKLSKSEAEKLKAINSTLRS